MTSHETTFIQLNDLHNLASYIPALPNSFSDFPLAIHASYFERGEKWGVMVRKENKMVWVFSEGISCLICRGVIVVLIYKQDE